MPKDMTTPTNWPNPERPGVPMFPERVAQHLLRDEIIAREETFYWQSDEQVYVDRNGPISPDDMADGFDYIGIILTSVELTELLAGERERCAKKARDISDKYYEQRESADNDDDRVYADERMCAAAECDNAIRNLGDAP